MLSEEINEIAYEDTLSDISSEEIPEDIADVSEGNEDVARDIEGGGDNLETLLDNFSEEIPEDIADFSEGKDDIAGDLEEGSDDIPIDILDNSADEGQINIDADGESLLSTNDGIIEDIDSKTRISQDAPVENTPDISDLKPIIVDQNVRGMSLPRSGGVWEVPENKGNSRWIFDDDAVIDCGRYSITGKELIEKYGEIE